MTGLEYFRRKSNMSVADLARKLGISRQCVSRWEHGVQIIPKNRIKELATLFDTKEEYVDKEFTIIDEIKVLQDEIKKLKKKWNDDNRSKSENLNVF